MPALLLGVLLTAVTLYPVAYTKAETPVPDEAALRDAYVYLLGRVLIIRQEQADMKEKGIGYNIIKYNPVGQPIGWVNPNLDVANNEAWIAVDQKTAAVLEIPQIEGRYYTAQICDEWGEVITNINERNYPLHPHGKYAFVTPDSVASVPDDAVRIQLRSPKAKMLARVEIRNDIEAAATLQKQFTLTTVGTPKIAPDLPVYAFDNKTLIGVEIFDHVETVLASAPDVSPVAAQLQSKARDVAKLIADPTQRKAINQLLHKKIIPAFQAFAVTKAGATKNNWIGTTVIGNYWDDFTIRTAANYIGIWANARHEVIYFVTTRDADGNQLSGSNNYVIDFPATDMPDKVVNAYWSLSLVDVPDFLAVANPLNRYTFNSAAPPPLEEDGSLKIFLAAEAGPTIPESNLLPSPQGKPFSLTFRTYVPKDIVKQGNWFPPTVRKIH